MWVGGFQNKIAVRIFLDHTVQSRLLISWAGKLLYVFLFQIDGRYTYNLTISPFWIPFRLF
jgi:hypothetical protein